MVPSTFRVSLPASIKRLGESHTQRLVSGDSQSREAGNEDEPSASMGLSVAPVSWVCAGSWHSPLTTMSQCSLWHF